ncbi:unnamed protein product [Dovyalis caffra]|uniref:Uncharacterized protein n=1 Tax=Dovyalis caffra TaxID=77055 RepID=A0AAV1RSP2_9ROSI|nr:unnamed protein product [Dovyalis caffra]
MTTLLPHVSLRNKKTNTLTFCHATTASLLFLLFFYIKSPQAPLSKNCHYHSSWPETKREKSPSTRWCLAKLCYKVVVVRNNMATGSADGFFRYVYDGCLSGGDLGIDRRPYHRNCRCALHKSKENCPHAMPRCKNVSYPIKRSWSEGSLALMVANSSSSCHSSPSSSPSLQAGKSTTTPSHQRRLSHDLEDQVGSFKV